ncbi:MAG: hypothetical protein ABR598_09545, partial [Candidatus Dormibacteria bacterium]
MGHERLLSLAQAARSRKLAGVCAALLIALTANIGGGITPALALHNSGVFELDGDIARQSATTPPYDWADLFNASGTPINVGAPLLTSAFTADYALPDTTYFATASKDIYPLSQWACSSQNKPLPADDLINGYAAVFQPTLGPDAGHVLLYLGQERLKPNGATDAGFWLFSDPAVSCTGGVGNTTFNGTHTVGDLLVVAEFGGGGVTSINVYEWDGVAPTNIHLVASGVDCTSLSTGTYDGVCGRVNTASINAPWPPFNTAANTLSPGTFFEAGIDLTAIYSPGQVPCVQTFLPETRSSPLTTADLKDYGITHLGGTAGICYSPTLNTQLQPASPVTAGTLVNDTATLSGASYAPKGTVTYKVFTDSSCTIPSTS